MNKVSFTGYRPQKLPFNLNPNDADYLEFYNNLYNAILEVATDNSNFYCGGAIGFDIIAGEIVLKIKEKNPTINLIMVVPFFEQSNDYTPSWRERYKKLISAAKEVVYVEQQYVNGCYFKRNRYLVDNSDILITYYNGQSGGTKYTVNYAEKKKRKIINICK